VQEGRRVTGKYRDEQIGAAKIFALALLASLLWHLFWLSTINIVSRPDNERPVRFSKVSFLGPLLGKGAMELQVRPKERTFFESRYLKAAGGLSERTAARGYPAAARYEGDVDTGRFGDERPAAAIDKAPGGEKLEPSYAEE